MKTIILNSAFVATLLFFLMTTCLPTSNAYGLSKKNTAMTIGRRAFVAQGIAFTSAALTTTTTRGDAAVATQQDGFEEKENNEKASRELKNKKEEQERKKAEKEAHRIAEETKKRLAVGRIGTI